MIIVRDKITLDSLHKIAEENYSDFVKAVVDIKREIMALGGELHADEESILIQDGSHTDDLWGINLYPSMPSSSWMEFDSVINIKPRLNNRSRAVEDATLRLRISEIVNRLVARE